MIISLRFNNSCFVNHQKIFLIYFYIIYLMIGFSWSSSWADDRIVWSEILTVEQSVSRQDNTPQIAISPEDGLVWVVWQRTDDLESHTYLKYSTNSGEVWRFPPAVSGRDPGRISWSQGVHAQPAIAISDMNSLLLLWQSFISPNIQQLYGQSFYPSQQEWRGPHSPPDDSFWRGKIDVTPHPDSSFFWVTWQRRNPNTNDMEIVCRRFIEYGVLAGRWENIEYTLSSGDTLNQSPAIAINPINGQAYLTFTAKKNGSNVVYAYYFDGAEWEPLLESGQITSEGNIDKTPTAAIDYGEKVWFAWSRESEHGSDIFTQSYQEGMWNNVENMGILGQDDTNPLLVVDQANRVWLFWQSQISTARIDIYGRYLDYGSDEWSAPIVINALIGRHQTPHIAFDKWHNRIWVVWEHSKDIYTRWLRLRPNVPQQGFSPANREIVRTQFPTISWQPAGVMAENLTYQVQLSINEDFQNSHIDTILNVNQTSWLPSSPLNDNQFWYYRVRTINTQGDTAINWSEVQQFVVDVVPEPPILPYDLITQSNLNQPIVTIKWKYRSDPDPLDTAENSSYQLQIFEFQEITPKIDLIVEDTVWTSPLLQENQIYEVRVRTIDQNHLESDWTEKRQFFINTQNDVPQVIILRPTPNMVWRDIQEIQWQATDRDHKNEELTIRIEYSDDGGESWRLLPLQDENEMEMTSNDGTYLWNTTGYQSSQSGRLRITATDPENQSGEAISELFSVTTHQIDIFPRAFSPDRGEHAQISFTLTEPQSVTVKIYNLAGRLKRTLINDEIWTPDQAAQGVYWDGKDINGNTVPDRLYICSIIINDQPKTKTVAVVRP